MKLRPAHVLHPWRSLAEWAIPPKSLSGIGFVRWVVEDGYRGPRDVTVSAGITVPISLELLGYVRTDKGTLWRRWPNMTELLNRAFDRAFRNMESLWDKPITYKTPEAQ